MDLSKSIAWLAFAGIVGAVGLGKDQGARPGFQPAGESHPIKTQVAQREARDTRESHAVVVGPVADRPIGMLRTKAP
jgi:hypothetical protein